MPIVIRNTKSAIEGDDRTEGNTKHDHHLKRIQTAHAISIVIVPLLGIIIAIACGVFRRTTAIDVIVFVMMYSVTMYLGVTIGFHRLLTHKAFETGNGFKKVLVVLGCMAAQGPPLYWVSNHRLHHMFSDQPGDPHSPYYKGHQPISGWRGLWHAHFSWTYTHPVTNSYAFAKDLYRDPVVMKINTNYYRWVMLGLLIPTAVGFIVTGSWEGALNCFIWGGMVRLIATNQATSSVNSITHYFGRRPFLTKERSTNVGWLAIPTGGESWHNNHHAFPASARFGLEWWQLDIGYLLIQFFEKLGVIHRVVQPSRDMIWQRLSETKNAQGGSR